MSWSTSVTRASAAVVALVAGYVSYLHIVAVALEVGERPEVAYALPVTIDALMVMSTLALMSDRRSRWAQAGFLFGVAVSVTANIASAADTWPARLVAAIPAVSLLLAVEVLVRHGRARPDERPVAAAGGRSSGRKSRRSDAASRVAAAMAANPGATVAALARAAGVSRSTIRRHNGHGADAP